MLQTFFGPCAALVVLDNLEQIIDGLVFIAQPGDACPGLNVLINSRESLWVPGDARV